MNRFVRLNSNNKTIVLTRRRYSVFNIINNMSPNLYLRQKVRLNRNNKTDQENGLNQIVLVTLLAFNS